MRIANLRSLTTSAGGSRVEADVDGEPLWFASDDTVLVATPEAFASAVLIASVVLSTTGPASNDLDWIWFVNSALKAVCTSV